MTQDNCERLNARPIHIAAYMQQWLAPRTVDDGDCLLWDGSVNKTTGLPHCSVDGKNGLSVRMYVFRMTRRLITGERLPRFFVVPSCRHRLCVHPLHLVAMTPGQSISFHAQAGAYRTPTSRRARQINGRKQSNITPEIAEKIRTDRLAGATISELSRRYPGCRSTIRKIVNHQSFVVVASPFAGLLAA